MQLNYNLFELGWIQPNPIQIKLVSIELFL